MKVAMAGNFSWQVNECGLSTRRVGEFLIGSKKEIMDIENEQEIRQLRTIAALYTKRSKLREAEAVYKSLLTIQEKHNGEFSQELALTCYQLAEVYADLGQYVRARPLYERAVNIWENLVRLELVKPEETIFFMDALVALQTNNEYEHEVNKEQADHQASNYAAKKSAAA